MSTEFARAVRDSGIKISEDSIINDGKLHRAHVEGDKVGSRNAWYVCFGSAGVFGCNKRGIAGKWRDTAKRQPLTQYDRERIQADRRARTEAQDRAYSDSAARAERIFQQATHDASEHAYVVRKGVQPHGVRENGHGLLVIPIYSVVTGKLQTVQFVDRDGNKKMLTGGRVKDGCFPFSDTPNFWQTAHHRTGLVEGFATGATLAETLHETATFAAFSAGNLKAVAQGLRARYPKSQIIIFGDNDANQIGQRCAMEAARAVDGFIAIPPTTGCDWNDVRGAA